MQDPPSSQHGAASAQAPADAPRGARIGGPSSPSRTSPLRSSESAGNSSALDDSSEAATTEERVEHCQGRGGENGHRVRPCARRPTLRVTGAGRVTADLCTQHARSAVDRPSLVQEWLQQEGTERDDGARVAGTTLSPDRPVSLARDAGQRARAGSDLVLRVPAELASVALVRAALSRTLRRREWAEELQSLVLMAVGEALMNAIEHGSPAGGTIEVGLTVTSEAAAVRVADEGRLGMAVPLGAPVAPHATSLRGRGRLLMLATAEQVEVRSDGRGTSVLLTFIRPAATAKDGGGPA